MTMIVIKIAGELASLWDDLKVEISGWVSDLSLRSIFIKPSDVMHIKQELWYSTGYIFPVMMSFNFLNDFPCLCVLFGLTVSTASE